MTFLSYRWRMLALLAAIAAFSNTDRLALGLMMPAIKVDLALSDTQLGFLTGLAFAFFYTLMGFPLSRWADRGDRVRLVYVTTALWSVMVCLAGATVSFAQLLAARIGVAIGEAGCFPAAFSMMGDGFTREERPKAVSLYYMGSAVSVFLGYGLGGWLLPRCGWRMTFVLIALPGILLAVLARALLREPRRALASGARDVPAGESSAPNMATVIKTLWSNRAFRNMWIAISIVTFFNDGLQQWLPSVIERSFHLGPEATGVRLALLYGCAGMLGFYSGGALSKRYAARNERLQLKLSAVVYVLSAVVMSITLTTSHLTLVLVLNVVTIVVGTMISGPVLATIQTLAPSRMRATAMMLMYLLANLVGHGLGPLATGALSDALAPAFGAESLRYALLALCPGYLAGTWFMWQASRTVSRDLEAMAVVEAQVA